MGRVELDAVLCVHAAFIVFVVFGALFALRWPRVIVLHLAALAWGIYIEASGAVCPLTRIEWILRDRLVGIEPHRDFLDRYVTSLIYPQGLTRAGQLVLGIALVVWSLSVYGWLMHRANQRKKTAPTVTV